MAKRSVACTAKGAPAERLARLLAGSWDQDEANYLAWEDWQGTSPPTPDQIMARWLRWQLDRQRLVDSERSQKWLLAFALQQVDLAAVERHLRQSLARFLPGAVRAAEAEMRESGWHPPEPDELAADQRRVLAELATLERDTPGNLHSFRVLRPAAKLSKSRFDRAVLGLARARRLVVHHHDYPAGLSDSERSELVCDEHGTYYVGAGLPGK